MFKEKIPIKIVVPVIVVTWILSLISTLAIVYIVPSLIPLRSEQIGQGQITSDKIANASIITVKLADGNVTSIKIADGSITAVDIANSSLTYVKLADSAIPHMVKYSKVSNSTNSTSFVDMPDMWVNLAISRNSTLVIIFSGQAKLGGNGPYALYVRAMIGTKQANPVSDTIILTYFTEYSSQSYTFYGTEVAAGTHTVKIQWRVFQEANIAWVGERTLTVIALPT